MGYKKYLTTGNTEDGLTKVILKTIEEAQHYIKLSSFLMQDYGIIDAIKKKSEEGKTAIFVLSNKKDKESEEFVETIRNGGNGKKRELGFDNHQKFLKELFYSGIHVRLLDDLHAKFIICDGTTGILMSANIAPNSLHKNVETGIELDNEDILSLEKVFDVMYNHADIVKFIGANSKDVSISVNNKLRPDILENIGGKLRLTVGSNNNTNLSLCHICSIYDSIISIINNAHEYLYISTWHFKIKDETLPEFMDSLKKACERHVNVCIYSNTDTPTPSVVLSKANLKQFHQWGCKTYGDGLNHSKCVISESEGIIFTANIDCVSGMKSGFEVGCMLTDSQRLTAKRHIDHQIEKIRRQRLKSSNSTIVNNKKSRINTNIHRNGHK